MNTLQAYLDHREGAGRDADKALRARADENWAVMGQSQEERLVKFDEWVCKLLASRLQWPDDSARKAKLIGQCRASIEKLVLELWRRGWMLDGKRLAAHITNAIDQVAARQRAGEIRDFWPFFQHVISSYVGTNAEEIQREARSIPTVGSLISYLGVKKAIQMAPASIPELIALRKEETLKERLAKVRKARKEISEQVFPQQFQNTFWKE